MKNKKIKGLSLLSASIISSYAAAQYVIVAQEKYVAVKGHEEVVTSEWVDSGSASCGDDIASSDVYYGQSFTQTETCDQLQTRTVDTYYVTNTGVRELKSSEVESQTETTTSTSTETGSHIENDCEDILNNNYSVGDGIYRVGFNNTDVYCDMTRNGGGWMRLTNYDFNEDPNNTPPGMVKTVNRTLTNYTGHPHTLRDGWYRPDVTSIPTGGYSILEVETHTNGFAWKKTMIEMDSLQEITPDSYNVATTSRDSTTVNGQYVDGVSFTYGNSGSRNHIHTIAKTTGYVTRSGLEWLYNSGDYTATNPGPGLPENPVVLLSDVITPTTSKISARLMLNQYYDDEKIGFTKYKVWVK